jgi:hypothetical protein
MAGITIPEAEEFNAAIAAWRVEQAKADDHRLDVRIAERDGDEEALKAAQAAQQKFTNGPWYAAYRRREAAAIDLCRAVGVDKTELKNAL